MIICPILLNPLCWSEHHPKLVMIMISIVDEKIPIRFNSTHFNYKSELILFYSIDLRLG